jgi:hypothetical protein
MKLIETPTGIKILGYQRLVLFRSFQAISINIIDYLPSVQVIKRLHEVLCAPAPAA